MANLIGQSLGRYHILDQLGEGGMATVYKAYDTRLERDVAIKIIRKGAFPSDHLEHILKRFEREAKALARLSHPNIVKVHDYGEHEGSPYLVMEYLQSGTLKQKMGKPMPWQEAVRLLIPIASALEYAHQHDIVHRDIKPSNILITENGQPMLSDFGVAKLLNADETMELTGTGVGIGTPEYMAPEQGSSKTFDHRVDIYSLGVVFYEMVTGRKPYTADTPLAVLIKRASEPLPRPKQFTPDLPQAVENVIFKALAKEPKDRYHNMGDFINALDGLIAGKAVAKKYVQQRTSDVHVRKKSNNLKFPIIPRRTVILIGLMVVGVGVTTFLTNTLKPLSSNIGPASPARTETILPTAFISPTTAVPITPKPTDVPSSTTTPQQQLISWGDATMVWPQQVITENNVNRLRSQLKINIGVSDRWSIDGDLIISPGEEYIAYSWGQTAFLLRVSDGQVQQVLEGHTNLIKCLAFSPNGEMVASGSKGKINIWNVTDGSLMHSLASESGYGCAIAFSPDGTILASSSTPGWGNDSTKNIVQLWNVTDGSLQQQFLGEPTGKFDQIAFSPDGTLIAVATSENEVLIWNIAKGSILRSLEGGEYDFHSLAFSPDGNLIGSLAKDGTIWLWRVDDASLLSTLKSKSPSNVWGYYYLVNDMEFSPDGMIIYIGHPDIGNNSVVELWRVSDGSLLHALEVSDLLSFDSSQDGALLAILSKQNSQVNIDLWAVTP